jgi:hypothetical protein
VKEEINKLVENAAFKETLQDLEDGTILVASRKLDISV